MEEEGRAVTFKSAKGDVSFTAKPKAKKKGKVVKADLTWPHKISPSGPMRGS